MNWAASLEPKGLKDEALARLETGRFVFRLYQGRQEEEAEDALAELLETPELESDLRKAVIEACDRIATRIWEDLPAIAADAPPESDAILRRWVNLVDAAKPPEMRPRATGLLQSALEGAALNPKLLGRLARAARSFKLDRVDLPVWEKLITIPQTAALAFRSIRQIDPTHPRVWGHLAELVRRSVIDKWPIAIGPLVEEVVEQEKDVEGMKRFLFQPAILEALAKNAPEYKPIQALEPVRITHVAGHQKMDRHDEGDKGITPFDVELLYAPTPMDLNFGQGLIFVNACDTSVAHASILKDRQQSGPIGIRDPFVAIWGILDARTKSEIDPNRWSPALAEVERSRWVEARRVWPYQSSRVQASEDASYLFYSLSKPPYIEEPPLDFRRADFLQHDSSAERVDVSWGIAISKGDEFKQPIFQPS